MADNFEKQLKDKQKGILKELSGAKALQKAINELLAAFKAKDANKYMKSVKAVVATANAEKKKSKDKSAQKALTDITDMVNADKAKRIKLKSTTTDP